MPGGIEVIDVDLLDDDVGQRPQAGPSQASSSAQSRSSISLLDDDSDDDEIQVVGMRRGPPTNTMPQRTLPGRSLFSPPPPPMYRPFPPPPVPPVPARYAGQTGYPPSRANSSRGHRVIPPVVRAVDRELIPNGEPRRRISSPPVAGPSNAAPGPSRRLHAAPRSHFTPSLGLGGALIAHNRARTAAERRGLAINPLRRIWPHQNGIDLDFSFEEAMEEFVADNEWRNFIPIPDFPPGSDDNFGRIPLREPQQYIPDYTHPRPLEAGFTADFQPASASEDATSRTKAIATIVINDDGEEVEEEAAEESQNEGNNEWSNLLVCARCHDPLVLNAGLSPSEATQRRIWGLRCGHLIDGRCMNEIGQPVPVAGIVDRKGKGKAKAALSASISYGEAPPSSNHHLQDETNIPRGGEDAGGSTIRSRLRSQNQPTDPTASSDTVLPYGATPLLSPSKKRKRGGAAKPRKPKVEEEFEWHCPVADCGQMHMSVKISGAWGPEKERQVSRKVPVSMLGDLEKGPRGAIPVFV